MKKTYHIKVYQTIAREHEKEEGYLTAISAKEAHDKATDMVSHNATFVKIIIKRM